MEFPINQEIVKSKINECGITDFSQASIREFVRLVNLLQQEVGVKFIRMEMGVPGLKASSVGVEAEIKSLESGAASVYPPIDGIAEFKNEASRFISNFINVNIPAFNCIPTVGAMQGAFASFMTACRRDKKREKHLFIDPGFPVQKHQMKVLGLDYESFDIYDYRGKKLENKLESLFQKGDISTILYSSPNNPSWACFTEEELEIIGKLCDKYDVVAIEDLAYFAMDFRQDFSKPGESPYQPSVSSYTDNYVLLISASKVFSYAGQRISILAISPGLASRKFPDLNRFFNSEEFQHALVYESLYTLTAGTAHSAQVAMATMLKKANSGEFKFIDDVKEYGQRANLMKQIFIENGFEIVYAMDNDKPIADGFYFTISYPGFRGSELVESLVYYGISAIPLNTTGSKRNEGVRACVSFVNKEDIPELKKRVEAFRRDNSV